MSSRVLFMTLGSFAGSAFAPAVLERLGRDAAGFAKMGMIFGVVVFIAMLTTFLGTSAARTREFVAHHVSFREQWRTALQNRPFLILMGVKVLQFIGIAAHASTLAHFVTTVMKRHFDFMLLYGVVVGVSTRVMLAGVSGVLLVLCGARRRYAMRRSRRSYVASVSMLFVVR